MFARIVFFLIALFWVTMNVLLWRAEYGTRSAQGSAVSVAAVWRKILTAPDSSSLSIFQRGQKIGFCHWVTSVGEAFSKLEEAPPEGMTGKVRNYQIQFEGNLTLRDFESRVRFESTLKLSLNQAWQEVHLRLNLRPTVWEIHSIAAEQTVRLKAEDGSSHFERVFRFADLQNPESLLGEFTGPFTLTLLGGLGLPGLTPKASPSTMNLRWEARYDTLTIGHEPVRVYRLQTRLLDRFPVTIFISRAGEILRAELPDDIVLMYDQLGSI